MVNDLYEQWDARVVAGGQVMPKIFEALLVPCDVQPRNLFCDAFMIGDEPAHAATCHHWDTSVCPPEEYRRLSTSAWGPEAGFCLYGFLDVMHWVRYQGIW
eukprot:7156161-Heterocapsa_arctica.AAC.1